jgi:hypothetical protein
MLAQGIAEGYTLRVDATHVYFTDRAGGAVRKVAK